MTVALANLEEARQQHAFCARRAKISALRAKMARDPDNRATWEDSQRSWEGMRDFWARDVERQLGQLA